MNTIVKGMLVAALALSLNACAGYAFSGVNQGMLYANSNRNERVTENATGSKKGEACASSILGWDTTGDASVVAAAKAGGLTKINSVDNTFTNIIGVWAKYCVVVTGE